MALFDFGLSLLIYGQGLYSCLLREADVEPDASVTDR